MTFFPFGDKTLTLRVHLQPVTSFAEICNLIETVFPASWSRHADTVECQRFFQLIFIRRPNESPSIDCRPTPDDSRYGITVRLISPSRVTAVMFSSLSVKGLAFSHIHNLLGNETLNLIHLSMKFRYASETSSGSLSQGYS